MNLSGKVEGGGWTVTPCARESGAEFGCLIGTNIAAPDGAVVREFMHDRSFCTQQEAVLDGVKEDDVGRILTTSNTIGAA